MTTNNTEITLRIGGLDCANCALTVEQGVAKLDGVQEAQLNFTTAILNVKGNLAPETIAERVEALGYHVLDEEKTGKASDDVPTEHQGAAGFLHYILATLHGRLVLIGSGLLLVSAALGLTSTGIVTTWLVLATHLSVIALAGFPIAKKGIRSLLLARRITIDLLMSIATVGAVIIGETGEAATVILLFAIGEALEGYTAERSRRSLRGLLALAPDTATVLRPCMDCQEHIGRDGYTGGPCPFCEAHEMSIPAKDLQAGEIVIVRPGERIPADGLVVTGRSSVNQAPITGESIPVSVSPDDRVFAGSVNGHAALEIQTTHPASDSTLARIVRLVEAAQANRAPIERIIDRFARWYTPAVVGLAVLVAVGPPLLFDAPLLDTPDGTRGWLYRALALLIVACPCALVISTPVSIASALTNLVRRGVLVKGGAYIEALSQIKTFAFDKTGTLTTGQPVVTAVQAKDCAPGLPRCESCDDMLALAASIERRSNHPLAQAVLNEAKERELLSRYTAAEQAVSLAGQGISGRINGKEVQIGSHRFFHERFAADDCGLHEQVSAAEKAGQTTILISYDEEILGFITTADEPRPSSQKALAELKAALPDARMIMLTGDHPVVADAVARKITHIDDVRAGLLPEDKLAAVEALEAQYGPVVMVGDGINDAPALAAATIGVAMGGVGTDQAMETADIVLMKDDLDRLPAAVLTSQRAKRIVRQNIAFSILIKAAFLILTVPGWATLWMAVFADMGASLLVTLNGLRLLDNKKLDFPES